MRIIGGAVRGRKLLTPRSGSLEIRPTSDRAREALFSILAERVSQAAVLDLFAGTGALGLEAFSREAAVVVFVDNNPLAVELIKKNVLRCMAGYRGNCQIRVICHDLQKSLPLKALAPLGKGTFDLIFADPPYTREISPAIVNAIGESGLLSPTGLLVAEERRSVELPKKPAGLRLIDRRIYGEAAFWFYQLNLNEIEVTEADAKIHPCPPQESRS
jgi:16S rRNA (guanine966-N2)-methyltransferase